MTFTVFYVTEVFRSNFNQRNMVQISLNSGFTLPMIFDVFFCVEMVIFFSSWLKILAGAHNLLIFSYLYRGWKCWFSDSNLKCWYRLGDDFYKSLNGSNNHLNESCSLCGFLGGLYLFLGHLCSLGFSEFQDIPFSLLVWIGKLTLLVRLLSF